MGIIRLIGQRVAFEMTCAISLAELQLPLLSLLEWWPVSLAVLLGIFALIVANYVIATFFSSARRKQYTLNNAIDQNVLDPNVLAPATLEWNSLDFPMVRIRHRIEVCARIATFGCVLMVLFTAALYLGFLLFGTAPSWYYIALSSFTYVSVYLVYRLWKMAHE